MSESEAENPLLRPDDRFKRAPMVREGELNPFSDAANPNPEPEPEFPTAVSYRPQYVAILPHRARMNTITASIALAVNLGFLFYYTDYWIFFWVFPLLAFVVSLASSWSSSGDIDAIENGAMDRDGLRQTRIALWIGWAAFTVSVTLMVLILGRILGWLRF